MSNPSPSRPRDINRVVFVLFVGAVLAADFIVLSGKGPFAS